MVVVIISLTIEEGTNETLTIEEVEGRRGSNGQPSQFNPFTHL